jgi:hypothetical protein
MEIRCGEVVEPTLIPAETQIASRKAHVEPLPLVPAI